MTGPPSDATPDRDGGGTPPPVGCHPGADINPESCLAADPALVADGWELRFITDSRRAVEAVNLYTELGYQVKTEPARTEHLKEECGGCRSLFKEFLMVYTRKA